MPAYMIVYASISDDEQFQAYVDAVGPLIAKFQGQLIARSAPPDILEGDWPWMTAGILQFPSSDHAHDFWSSGEYSEVKQLRQDAADFQVVLVNAA